VFVGGDQQARCVGVKMRLLGTKMTVIPVQLVSRMDPNERTVWVSMPKDVARSGPVFERDHEFTPEDEQQIWDYYGLGEPLYRVTEIFVWREAS
jgi:hypothetical protein